MFWLEKIVDELEDTGPVINRFFLNVAIPKTEACSDSSGNFILYCIQYEGVYVEENDDGQLEKLVLRTTTIKRRFQEFLMLQSHMEESSLWRPHIKGIKAPNKWLNLSFTKSESTNLSQRKINLEKYLQQLCYHPVLGFCPQLRQFMAYGEEGFQAFASSDAIPLHRFDKLAKKFTGVFNSLRDALPSFEPELLTTNVTDPVGKSPTDNKAKSLFSSFLRAEKMDKMEESVKAMEDIDNTDSKPKDDSVNTDSNSGSNPSEIKSDIGINLPAEDFSFNSEPSVTNASETLNSESLAEGAMDAVYPLAVAATQLLCDVLWLPHHRPHSASVAAFLSISGKPFENYLQDFLDILFSKEAFLGYVEMATAAIKEWAKEEDNPVDQEPEIPGASEEDLKICLKQKIPVWVRWMWGRSRLDMTIDRLTKVCQETQINQDLILSLVELLFSKLVDSIELETEELK
ncbi:unnamed protein product [Allacma fusca]|uniref:PX domain-containing protein n=1 Tax=Allacma fusca TaxID=39272 RepID=A0A8J2KFI7_9HEXA|nr:unnamed protein product [Allacma fusca]